MKSTKEEIAKLAAIAREVKPNITHGEEWEEHIVFYNEQEAENDGGPGSPIVVEKKTGKTMPYGMFLATAPVDDTEYGTFEL